MSKEVTRQSLRDWLSKKSEEKERGGYTKLDNLINIKVGKSNSKTLKIIPWNDPETDLVFHAFKLNWVRTKEKTYTFRAVDGNVIDRVAKLLRKSKNDDHQKLAYNIEPKDTMLFHVIDMDDLQWKVLSIDDDGGMKIVEKLLESKIDPTELDNKLVIKITKELENYKNKKGQSRNRRAYDVQIVEDEAFSLLPKTRTALEDLPDLSQVYTAPNEDVAHTVISKFLTENHVSEADIAKLSSNGVDDDVEEIMDEPVAQPLTSKVSNTMSVDDDTEDVEPEQETTDESNDMARFLREGLD